MQVALPTSAPGTDQQNDKHEMTHHKPCFRHNPFAFWPSILVWVWFIKECHYWWRGIQVKLRRLLVIVRSLQKSMSKFGFSRPLIWVFKTFF